MSQRIKVLIYIEPWIERDFPSWKTAWIDFLSTFCSKIRTDSNNSFNFLFIIGDSVEDYASKILLPLNFDFKVIYQSELKKIFSHYNDALISWQKSSYSEKQLVNMMSLIKEKISDYYPDLIWSFISPIPFLKKMFPNATFFYQEIGFLCRPPYPISWFFDHSGTFQNSFLSTNSEELLKKTCSPEALSAIQKIQTHFFDNQLVAKNPLTKKDFLEEKFSKLIFVPLQYSGHFVTDGTSNFKSQLEFLETVLEYAPSDCAVVPTEHINPLGYNLLNYDVRNYFTKKYQNFIYNEKITETPMVSQYLIPLSDLVITISSTIGLQALFYGKKVISPSYSHIAALAHSNQLEDISSVLNSAHINAPLGAFEFLLTHYYIPQDLLLNPSFNFAEYLKDRIRLSKEPNDFDKYPAINNITNICDIYINSQGEPPTEKIKVPKANLESHIINLEEEKIFLNKQIKILNNEIQSMNNILSHELSETSDKLTKIENSTMWRLTHPIRKAIDWLKRI